MAEFETATKQGNFSSNGYAFVPIDAACTLKTAFCPSIPPGMLIVESPLVDHPGQSRSIPNTQQYVIVGGAAQPAWLRKWIVVGAGGVACGRSDWASVGVQPGRTACVVDIQGLLRLTGVVVVASVVTSEVFISWAGVVVVASLVATEMLARVTGVISVAVIVAVEVLTSVTGVISVASLVATEMLARGTVVVGVASVVATEMLTRVTGVIGVAVDLIEVGDSVLVLASAGGARRRRYGNASVMTLQLLTRGTGVVVVTRVVATEMLTRGTCVIGVTVAVVTQRAMPVFAGVANHRWRYGNAIFVAL